MLMFSITDITIHLYSVNKFHREFSFIENSFLSGKKEDLQANKLLLSFFPDKRIYWPCRLYIFLYSDEKNIQFSTA